VFAGQPQAPITSTAQMPAPVINALVALCAPCSFADVGAPWQDTDFITGDLPQRRLVRVEHSGSEWIIEYEHGGRGKHLHSATFSTLPEAHFVRGSCGSSDRKVCEW
jgi:hypothetical protein